jgi:hypothetical protein
MNEQNRTQSGEWRLATVVSYATESYGRRQIIKKYERGSYSFPQFLLFHLVSDHRLGQENGPTILK